MTVLTEAVDDLRHLRRGLIDHFKSGAFQMAVVPARAWSAAGVTSLKALQAPFLFDSDEHVAAAVEDPAITTDLLSGFDGSGVTGLALFPESLRHLFSFGEPMLGPADVKGRTIRAISSRRPPRSSRPSAARPSTLSATPFRRASRTEPSRAPTAALRLPGEHPDDTAIATGNVTLYAKVMSLVTNSAFLAGLDDAQRDIVAKASDATRAWAIANQATDADAAAMFCKGGGTVVLADAAGRRVSHGRSPRLRASRPIRRPSARLRPSGPRARHVIGTRPGLDRARFAQQALVPDGGDLPDGIYRVEFSDEYLQSWGVSAPDNHGVYTFTLNDGQWSAVQRADNITDDSAGIYRAEGHDVVLVVGPSATAERTAETPHVVCRRQGHADVHTCDTHDADFDMAWSVSVGLLIFHDRAERPCHRRGVEAL